VGGFGHACIFVDGGENRDNGAATVVAEGFDLGFFRGKRLRSNCSIGVKQCLNRMRDCALQESSVVVDEIGKAVVIKGSVDLLNDGPLNEVAGVEHGEVVLEELLCFVDLCDCRVRQIGDDWKDRTVKWYSGGDSIVGGGAADQSKVSLETATQGGTNTDLPLALHSRSSFARLA
jgi:hypothetical protein